MQWIYVIVTAMLSSALTLAACVVYFRKVAEPRLRQALDRELLLLGDLIEKRVRAGVVDAVGDVASGDPLIKATKKATRSGATFVEDSLGILLGHRKRRDKSDD